MKPDLVPSGNVLKRHGGELAIGDTNDGPFGRADTGRAQPNVNDCASSVAEAANVSNQNGTIPDYRNSAEQVLDCLLRSQGDGESTHSKARQNRGRVVPPYTENA